MILQFAQYFNMMMRVLTLNTSIVYTTTGPIKGKLVEEFGARYYSYEGIPYAEKPVGDLRFKPPVAKTPWKELLDATNKGYVCPQSEGAYKREQMSEDCLFVNVYVPANKTESLMPVLAFIPGGEFQSLSSYDDYLYGPQLLLRHDIMIATISHRLGALGFLSLDIEEASGNAGLKDALLAMKWINANVERFGGNRNRITLAGNSAGAVAVHYTILTTKSVGLFNQAVLLSGSALGYRFLARHAKENALALGKLLNISANTTHELLHKLKNTDAYDIVQSQQDYGKANTRNGFRPFAPFVPNIEINYPGAVITEDPREIIKAGIPNNVPILAGFAKDEGLKMYPVIRKETKLADYLNKDFQLCIPSNIEYPYGSQESEELARSIRKFYFDGGIISISTIQNFVDLITDTMFSYSINYWIDLHKQRKNSKELYYYVFGFDGELNWFKIKQDIQRPGAAHADDLGYLFVTEATKSTLNNTDARSQRMVQFMTATLTNFVKFGDPTPQNNDVGIFWNARTSEKNSSYLYIDEEPMNKAGHPIPERLKFWQDVYDQYYAYLQNGGKTEQKIVP